MLYYYTITTADALLATGQVQGSDNGWNGNYAYDRVESILRATAGSGNLSGLDFKGNGSYGYTLQIKTDKTYVATIWSADHNGAADVINHLKQGEHGLRYANMID